ncbi:MAG: sugar phosphate isomerase/epimerase [Deltaproteobacteria bacterium]|nr:MAG: sugar phosphate isomerase/epimerase [Deltaproteobacteria bacterium]
MLGISTCWWANRIPGEKEIVSETLGLGLKGIELDYRISNAILEDMVSRLKRELKVLSIHNFFPMPEGMSPDKASGDLFLLSSIDRDERSKAVRYSIRTIEYAHKLGARAVVFHLGRVDMPNPSQDFFRLYRSRKISEREGLAFIKEQKRIRQSSKRKNLDAVLLSLEGLNREAEKRGIFVGIENRYHFHEIPDLEEIGLILRRFKGGNIRYWHDVGHARVQENMGISNQRELLDAYKEHMIGIHLHDVRGLDDHLAPGQGEMEFSEIKAFLKPSIIRVLEVHPKVKRKALLEGIRFVKEVIIGNDP